MAETTKENNWSYRNDMEWKRLFGTCVGDKQSPINIDTSKVAECNEICRLSARFVNSSCHVSNNNRTPIVRFDRGNFIKFRDIIYELTKMTLHTPSMHSMNGKFYDLEAQLYFCLNPGLDSVDSGNDVDSKQNISFRSCDGGGVILSIFFQRGSAESYSNMFFSQFISQIPSDETLVEKTIKVNKHWSPELIIPERKTFFYYNGSLPVPPCDQTWTWVLFDEINIIDKTLFETFEAVFKNNTRREQRLGSRTVYYNNNPNFEDEDEYNQIRLNNEIKRMLEMRQKLINKPKYLGKKTSLDDRGEAINLEASQTLTSQNIAWYVEHKARIKEILVTVILVLSIILAVKFTKYLVRSGTLSSFSKNVIEGSKKLAKENKAAEAAMAANQNMGNNMGNMGNMGNTNNNMGNTNNNMGNTNNNMGNMGNTNNNMGNMNNNIGNMNNNLK